MNFVYVLLSVFLFVNVNEVDYDLAHGCKPVCMPQAGPCLSF